jgi:serine/threonine protein kinase
MQAPLFPGDSEIDQLFKIFKVFGTPNEHNWPGVSTLPDYKSTFPQWPVQRLVEVVPQLDTDGIDLLQGMLVYEPGRRISARQALQHPYFKPLFEE